jgi:hypothetical protein
VPAPHLTTAARFSPQHHFQSDQAIFAVASDLCGRLMPLLFRPRARVCVPIGFPIRVPSASVIALLAFSFGVMRIIPTRIREFCGQDQHLRSVLLRELYCRSSRKARLACSPGTPYWLGGFFFDETTSAIMRHLEGTALVTAMICGQARLRQPQERAECGIDLRGHCSKSGKAGGDQV